MRFFPSALSTLLSTLKVFIFNVLILNAPAYALDPTPLKIEDLTPRAEKGEATAQHNLALALRESNPKEALRWYKKAAKQGLQQAQHNLADMIRESNPNQAIRWYKKAAKQGYAPAQNDLAFLLVETDLEEAIKWWRKAAQKRLKIAQKNLYKALKSKNEDEDQKKAKAKWQLGNILKETDPEQAVKLYTKSAQKGFANAQYSLACMINEKKPDQAVKWLIKAAKQDHQPAKSSLRGRIQAAIKSSNSEGNLEKYDVFLGEVETVILKEAIPLLDVIKARANPEAQGKFEDSTPNQVLYSASSTVLEDLETFQTLARFLDEPGFLITCAAVKFNIFQTLSKKPFIGTFHFGNRSYLCLGEDVVQAAATLQLILPKLQKNVMLQTIIDSIEGEETLQVITALKSTLEGFADEYYAKIQNPHPRNKKFIDMYDFLIP